MRLASTEDEVVALKLAHPGDRIFLRLPDGSWQVHLPHGAGVRVYPPTLEERYANDDGK